jgi:hypothetical protein
MCSKMSRENVSFCRSSYGHLRPRRLHVCPRKRWPSNFPPKWSFLRCCKNANLLSHFLALFPFACFSRHKQTGCPYIILFNLAIFLILCECCLMAKLPLLLLGKHTFLNNVQTTYLCTYMRMWWNLNFLSFI